MKKIILAFFTVIVCTNVFAQNDFFTDAGANRTFQTTGPRVIIPQNYQAATLNIQGMKSFLWSLPSEKNVVNRSAAPVIELPMPDGSMAKFRVWENSIQEPGLEVKFPDIKTFAGQGISDPYATIRFDIGPNGFHAQVLTANGTYYIDPYSRGDINNYISYFRTDYRKSGTFLCEVPDNPQNLNTPQTEAACLGTDLRTYRLAVACTGEYAQAPGINAGASAAILHNAIVTTVNRVVGVYEKEVSIRMVLVANNSLVEFLDPDTDPFTGNGNAGVLINESQTVINANIGAASYDIGHTFSTGGGGLAQLSSVCGSNKARGITGNPSPTGDSYDIDYVAHEIGHQFGGRHSFNGQIGNCSGGNRNGSTAYEPGSGTTIQAYAGICGSDDIQPNSDPHFHAISFDEISNFVAAGGSCAVITPTGNTIPVIDPLPNNGLTIPVNTPFTLTGSATDANGDALTYCWEEWDLGPQGAWNSGGTSTTAPLFKSRVPKTTGSRTFPDINVILAGYPVSPAATLGGLKGETLPQVARAMKFKLTVRDNRAGGGGVASSGAGGCQSSSVYQINVDGTSPFAVTSPNGGEIYNGGSLQTITWNAVNTDQAPFNVANVKISLSTDGGLTYPTIIIASTPNDGSEVLTIPSVVSTTAKMKIEAIGNIFFDISNANFIINAPPAGFTFNSPAPVVSACPAATTMQTTLTATYTGGFTTPIVLTGSVNPTGPAVTFGTNPLTTGTTSTTVVLNGTSSLPAGNYVVTVTGTAGAIVQTRDITFTINPGTGPAIATQPSTQTVCAGANATFTVAATGTYQWQVSTVAAPAFTNISGASAASLTITGVTAAQNGNQYRCVVSGQCGNTNSNAAALVVSAPPAITTHPQSVTLCAGSNNTFSVAAAGAGLTYQWQISTAAVPAFTNIASANSNSYTVSGSTAAMNGDQYRCIVSGTCTPAVTSNAATLTVISPVVVSTNPGNAQICSGSNASFTVAGTSAQAIIYQWQISTVAVPAFTDIAGANAATLSLTPVAISLSGNQYRCLLSNATCPAIATSNAAALTVRQLPTVGLAAAPLSALLPGQSTTLTATPSAQTTGTLTTAWLKDGNTISNIGNTRNVNIENTGTYRVNIQEVFTGGLVCSNQSPDVIITATVSNKLFIFPSPNNGQFTVSYYNTGGTNTSRTVTVYDSKGDRVRFKTFPVTGPYTLLSIDIRPAQKGMYYVVAGNSSGKVLAKGKVVVQ